MKEKEYLEIVNKKSKKENKVLNVLIAFFFGGLMGITSEGIAHFLRITFEMPKTESYIYTSIIVVVISALLTGLGFFDKIVSFAKAGLIVPTTGFAHAMTCAALDYRKEGFVKGIGGNMFKLTGSIIIYTIIISFFVALIKGVLS